MKEEGGNKPRLPGQTPPPASDTKASQRGVAVSLPSELSDFQLCLVLLHVPLKSLIEMTYKLKHLPTCLALRKDQSELILIIMEERSLER